MCQTILINGLSIIDHCVTSPISNALVRRIIPALVNVVVRQSAPITYGDLAIMILHDTPRLGYQLGCIVDILECLSANIGERIPSITAICVNAHSGLPGASFDRVHPDFPNLPYNEKINALNDYIGSIYAFEGWMQVLSYLGLDYDY